MGCSVKTLGLLIAIMMFFSVCTNGQEQVHIKKILIVYLSRTNNTKAVAEIIHQQVGGKLVALELQNPYPENYKATVNKVAKENGMFYLPLLKTKVDNVDQYDIIFIGFPTWGMQLPPPMKSFLHQYDLAGKTIIPFNTNAGYGIGSTFQTVRTLCPKSKVLDGFTVTGGIERDRQLLVIKGDYEIKVQADVKKWLAKLPL